MSNRQSYVIIGAGLCGLSTAERLVNAGHDVTVLEKLGGVAGLARSFNDDGFIFDVGPHYFFLNVREDVSDYARKCVKGGFSELDFRISTHFKGREIAWPPSPTSLFKLPIRSGIHYFRKMVKHEHPRSFDYRGFTTELYGDSMYRAFFGPYIEKKLPTIKGPELHRDWWILARRTIDNDIDIGQDRFLRKVGGHGAQKPQGPPPLKKRILKGLDMAYKMYLNMTSRNMPRVLYPDGGIGMIGEGIAEKFVQQGGKLVLNCGGVKLTRAPGPEGKITRVEWQGDKPGAIENPDHVVWTGTIHELADQLSFERAKVDYLSIALVYVTTKKPLHGAKYFYTYYSEPDLIFNRLYFPTRACTKLAPPGCDAVCAEVSPPGGLDSIDRPALEKQVIDGLVKLGHLKPEDVLSVKMRVARDSYPIYPLDYLDRLKVLWDQLKTVPNLSAVGRTGQFYYNNMALTICLGMDLSRRLLGLPSYWEEKAAKSGVNGAASPTVANRDH